MSKIILFLGVPHFCFGASLFWCVLFTCCWWSFMVVVCCSCCIFMQFGMSFSFVLEHCLSLGLIFHHLCFLHDFILITSLLWTYKVFTLYGWSLSSVHCNLCNSMATYWWLLPEVYSWWLYLPLWQSSNDEMCYCIFFSAADWLLLVKAIGLWILLFGTSSLGQLTLSLACSSS